MRHAFILLTMILAARASGRCVGDRLVVYPPVPGLAASEHYTIRVRPAGGGDWQPVFAWQTTCKAIEPKTDGYFDTLAGWNDANGSSFVLSSLPQLADRELVVEDCDVIYARATWHHWTGGRVFTMHGEGGGAAGAGVVFRNINVEDSRPTLQQFFLCMTVPPPYSRDGESRTAGDLAGVRFENISIAAPSVLGEPQLLWGHPDARIHDLTFDNLSLAGKPVREAGFFQVNEYVNRLVFPPSGTAKP